MKLCRIMLIIDKYSYILKILHDKIERVIGNTNIIITIDCEGTNYDSDIKGSRGKVAMEQVVVQ